MCLSCFAIIVKGDKMKVKAFDANHELDLEDEVTYEVYLTAYNDIGISNKSKIYSGKTLSINPPISPNYKLNGGKN